jgi:hypothetical protein
LRLTTSNLDRLKHLRTSNLKVITILDDFLKRIATAGFTMPVAKIGPSSSARVKSGRRLVWSR